VIVLANFTRIARQVLADVLRPPPPVDYEAWAREHIVFSERESQYPGPYNSDLFPFFAEILKALGPEDPCRTVTFLKSAQLGGTVLANIFTLGSLDLDPNDMMYVHPTEDNARRWSRLKLSPMMKNSARLRLVFPERTREAGDSTLFKERVDGRGSLTISGASSSASLSQVTMFRQVQDDLAKWDMNNAGDPETQADSRSRAVEFAKIFKISTPLVLPGCRITRQFEAGSQEEYHVPCPHCGHEQTLDWENFLSNLDEDRPENACFSCIECGGVIQEFHRPEMMRRGRWIARNPGALRHHRSFTLWSAYSRLQSFERIAREWISARGAPDAEKTFFNDTVGRAYQVQGEAPPWEEIRNRADGSEFTRGRIPAWGLLVTVGVDVQKDRVEWQAVCWSRDGRRAIIDHDTIAGHVTDEACREGLDRLLRATWRHQSGRDIGVDMLAIDGNAWTEDVFGWVRRHPASQVIMVRGVAGDNAPLIAKVQRERSHHTGKPLKYRSRFFNFGTSVLKMAFYRNLLKTDEAERGFVAIPSGMGDEFFKQLTAERRVSRKKRDGFTDYRWEKHYEANEALDTHLQAEAAAIKFGIRGIAESAWDRFEAERATPSAEAQLDLEDMAALPLPPIRPAPAPIAAPRARQVVRSPYMDR
jgi:phage terminase large subunit GpA-like protein